MQTTGKFILDDDGNPVEETDLIKWATWYETSAERRRVALDTINGKRISTIFLAMDFDFMFYRKGKPILWETMIFDAKERSIYSKRYTSLADAKAGHAEAVKLVRSEFN
jgi:hypothetical protein